MNNRPALRFVSCLPRSGSTLLCNILAQNPRYHATPTSGLCDVVFRFRNDWEKLTEHKAAPSPERKKAVMQSILYSYHSITNKEVVFDKSRGWVSYIDLIEDLTGEKMKILCTVRPIVDILASLEKLYRKTSVVKQAPGEARNYHKFISIAGRCDFWMQPNQLVGVMITRIDEVINRGLKDRIHFIQYENLTKSPEATMRNVYKFLEEEYYQHDYNNVEQVTIEDDDVHGFIDLHKIKKKVEYVQSDALKILGPEVYDKYKEIYFKLT